MIIQLSNCLFFNRFLFFVGSSNFVSLFFFDFFLFFYFHNCKLSFWSMQEIFFLNVFAIRKIIKNIMYAFIEKDQGTLQQKTERQRDSLRAAREGIADGDAQYLHKMDRLTVGPNEQCSLEKSDNCFLVTSKCNFCIFTNRVSHIHRLIGSYDV